MVQIPKETNWHGQPRKVDGAMEKLLSENSANNSSSNQTQQTPTVQSSSSYWQIPVNYRNGIYVLDLSKSLLDGGSGKTQDQWTEYSKQAKANGDFYVGDMPLYHSLFRSLCKNPTKESGEARDFIKSQMRAKWLMTLTRIAYQPKGKDKVIHNYGQTGVYQVEENIVGEDREITKKDGLALKTLLGTDDVDETKEVYNWINQTPTWLWRVNSKPSQVIERVARFGASSGRAGLGCNRDPDDSSSSLGVRVREAPKKT